MSGVFPHRNTYARLFLAVVSLVFTKEANAVGPDVRIIGGAPAGVDDHPWLVNIQLVLLSEDFTEPPEDVTPPSGRAADVYGYVHYCNGVILNPNWFLTADPCFNVLQEGQHLRYVAGDHSLNVTESSEQVVKMVKKEVIGGVKNYTRGTFMAIVKVDPPFQFNDKVKALKVPPPGFDLPGTLYPYGWGVDDMSGTEILATDVPHTVAVELVDQKTCNKKWSAYNLTLFPDEFCAGGSNGKGVCLGDSGGPVVGTQDAEDYIVGMNFIHLPYCNKTGEFPDIFLKMSVYHNKIAAIISDGSESDPPNKKPAVVKRDTYDECFCENEDEIVFGISTCLVLGVCKQQDVYDQTKEIQPPLKYPKNDTSIACAHFTWNQYGYACFNPKCPQDIP